MRSILIHILGVIAAGALTILAIVVTYSSSHLSLAVPQVGNILALLLPGLNYLHLAFPYYAERFAPALVPSGAFTILLSILDAVLATLAASRFPSELLRCSHEARWQALFVAKDADPVRIVQDALQCCGLWSTVDRAWPFPDRSHGPDACMVSFNRNRSCGELWLAQTKYALAVWISIGIYGILLKAAFGILRNRGPGATSWYHNYRAIERAEHPVPGNQTRYIDETAAEDHRSSSAGAIEEQEEESRPN